MNFIYYFSFRRDELDNSNNDNDFEIKTNLFFNFNIKNDKILSDFNFERKTIHNNIFYINIYIYGFYKKSKKYLKKN